MAHISSMRFANHQLYIAKSPKMLYLFILYILSISQAKVAAFTVIDTIGVFPIKNHFFPYSIFPYPLIFYIY